MNFANKFRPTEKNKNNLTAMTTFYNNINDEKKENSVSEQDEKLRSQSQYEEMEKFDINHYYNIMYNYLPELQNTSNESTYFKLELKQTTKDVDYKGKSNEIISKDVIYPEFKMSRVQTSNHDKRSFFQ